MASVQKVRRKLGVAWRHCRRHCDPAELASKGSQVSGSGEMFFSSPKWTSSAADSPVLKPFAPEHSPEI